MAKVFVVLFLVLLAIPALVVADPSDVVCNAGNAVGACGNGTGQNIGPGMMRAGTSSGTCVSGGTGSGTCVSGGTGSGTCVSGGTGSGTCVNGGAGGCDDVCPMMDDRGNASSDQYSCGMMGGVRGYSDNSSCGVTGGDGGSGYGRSMMGGVPGGMMGGYGYNTIGYGMNGWADGGSILFLILAIVWIIVGILLIFLLFRKLTTKGP